MPSKPIWDWDKIRREFHREKQHWIVRRNVFLRREVWPVLRQYRAQFRVVAGQSQSYWQGIATIMAEYLQHHQGGGAGFTTYDNPFGCEGDDQ